MEQHVQPKWEHGSDERFTQYYVEASLSSETIERFSRLMEKILKLLSNDVRNKPLEVADIGCGPGAQAGVWASRGHLVHGLDINKQLIDIARDRAKEQDMDIEYLVGSATELPWTDGSMDLCLLPELLEHVADWQLCIDEAIRVLKPGGTLYLSTSNKLCPVQQEFRLPLYSWYPQKLKRHYEQLSVTTRPELVNYAPYPAVNWFSYYSLRRVLSRRGMQQILDRFEFNALTNTNPARRKIFKAVRALHPLRFLGQIATPYTLIVAKKS